MSALAHEACTEPEAAVDARQVFHDPELEEAMDALDALICDGDTTAALFALDDIRAMVREENAME